MFNWRVCIFGNQFYSTIFRQLKYIILIFNDLSKIAEDFNVVYFWILIHMKHIAFHVNNKH